MRRPAGITDAALDRALARGEAVAKSEPRFAGARFDAASGRIAVELTNGCTFTFPARLAPALERASDAELAQVEILGAGYGLHWEALDVDLSVPGLLRGLFGTAQG